MNTKHTPGPWEIRYKPNGYPDLITAPNESTQEPGNIVDIIRKASFCSPSMPESQANAHLIASAPDLLEAGEALLSMYVAMINSGDCGNWNPEEEKEVINLRAAISKAKGVQP